MEYKFELEDRRIEAERLERMSDRELLLLIAKKVTKPDQPAYSENVKESIAFAILNKVHESPNKRDLVGFQYMVNARCETTSTTQMFRVPVEFNDTDINEIREAAFKAAGKLAAIICGSIKESELHRFSVDLAKFSDLTLG